MGTDWPVLCLFRALPLASGEQGLGGREGVLEPSSVEEGDAKVHTCGQSAVNRRPAALQAALLERVGEWSRPWSWADLRVTGDRFTERVVGPAFGLSRGSSAGPQHPAPCPAGGLP